MKNSRKILVVLAFSRACFSNAQETLIKNAKVIQPKDKLAVESNQKGINGINNGMPNRISMNVTVAKQTQGATFGEKVNSGKININLTENGCVILFPLNAGYKINLKDNTINELTKSESLTFGEKVNQGLHAAGNSIGQGASLLGGALGGGGSIVSASVSSVSS